MSTSTEVQTSRESRVLQEGYGPGAWHGPDLKAALTDVGVELAFWRPAAGRHNIAEIVLHHAYCIRSVRSQISGKASEPFVMTGEDWFALDDERGLSWPAILQAIETEQSRLRDLVAAISTGSAASPLEDEERFSLALGIACHAIYHAGQIQLIKRLHGG